MYARHTRWVERIAGGCLVAAGVKPEGLDEIADTLPDALLADGIHWVAYALETEQLMSDIEDATSRVSSLVSAAKQYSQLDRAPLQAVDGVLGGHDHHAPGGVEAGPTGNIGVTALALVSVVVRGARVERRRRAVEVRPQVVARAIGIVAPAIFGADVHEAVAAGGRLKRGRPARRQGAILRQLVENDEETTADPA